MALRHAVLAALLDGEYSGYQLAKAFDIGVANFWHALPQQLYLELTRLERDGLVSGREVVQESRPNKRLFTVTDAGMAELERFAASAAKPSFIRDDLMVKVQAVDHTGAAPVLAQLRERAEVATAKIEIFDQLLLRLRDDDRIGPYLTCLRGRDFERQHRDWCLHAEQILRERSDSSQTSESEAARADQ